MACSSLDHAQPLQAGQVAHAAEVQGEHGQDGDLGGERLGAGDADLRARRADRRRRRPRGRCVLPTTLHSASVGWPLRLRLAQGRQRVGRLARLRDGDDDGVAVDGRIAIAELAGVLDLDGDAGELLEQILADQRRVIAGAAGRQDDALDLAQLLRCRGSGRRSGRVRVGVVEPAAQGVLQRFGLLVNLLEHVVLEVALVGVARRPSSMSWTAASTRRGRWSRMCQSSGGQHAHLMIVEVNDLVGVAGQGGRIAGQEVLALADAEHQRTAQAGADEHVGIVAG